MTTETVLTQDMIIALSQMDSAISTSHYNWQNKRRVLVGRAIEQAVLQSPEIQRLREDAERYQTLRNEEYQMLENDPCVADDSFNAFFGDGLDAAVDALKARRDAAMKEQP